MPVHNEEIAALFEEMADLLEIKEANPFRIRAYRNAARTIRGLGRDLRQMVACEEDLTRLPGIGKDLAVKIKEILATGRSATLDKLHTEVPASLEALLKIPGLGPKRVQVLYRDLHIKTLKQLERAARRRHLQRLPGFGAKTERRILQAITARHGQEHRFLHSTARSFAEPLVAYLKSAPGVMDVIIAGSFRRGKDTVGDLDVLLTAESADPAMQHFVDYDEVLEVVSRGSTRSTVFLRNGLQVDVRVVEQGSFGAALQYFTGSKTHNIQIRRLGQQLGLKINEYGVFKGGRRVAGETELSVYKSLGLPFIDPELREGRGEVDAAKSKTLPKLVTLNDLRGDLHVHTRATDGDASIESMARAAQQRGLKYIAITDHSQHLTFAHGLNEGRLSKQIDEIDRVNEQLKGITILKGIELDILNDGRLDLPDSVLAKLDLVVGAVHSNFRLSRIKQTERILRAIDSKYFTILAHPTCCLLGKRDGIDVDMPRVIKAVKERGSYLELNSQPMRMDMHDVHCRNAKEEGVLISINSDSHCPAQFDYLKNGINQARRGWLERKDVINTRSLRELRKHLKRTMG